MEPVTPNRAGLVAVPKDRLDSWKEIATHLGRDVRTVQRWERDWSLPVHRLPGGSKARVYGYRSEIDEWAAGRRSDAQLTLVPAPAQKRKTTVWYAAGAIAGVLILAGVWAFSVIRNPSLARFASSRYTPFATGMTVQVCPSWSPDGKSIAFSTSTNGFPQLMVQPLTGAMPVPVTGRDVSIPSGGDPMWCQPPFWAPNSQSLYFIGEGQAGRGLFRVSAGGGESILMQRGASAAAISPDGNSVVFLAPSPDDRKLIVWTASPPQGERRAYEPAPLRATGFRNRPVLAFRPNGKSVFLLISLGKETQAWDLPWPPDRSRRVFTKAERSVGAPLSIRWMPDSQHLIFAADALAVADIATERYWPIAVQDRPMKSPTPSPDGKRVAYQSSLSHADVIAVPLDGGAIETLAGSMAWEEMPASSPVAAQITYKSAKNPSGIWIKNLADGSERNLVEQRTIRVAGERVEFLATPVFSGNGKKILFGAVGPAGGTLFTVPADGGSPVRTAEAIDGGTAFTWSPDEKWIAFRRTNENRPRLMKVRAGTAEPAVELASLCGRCMPEWSPTGEWIAYTNESCRLALIRPDKSESRLLGDSGTVAWSRDGATLYRISAEKRTLTAIDVATGRERILRDLGDLLPYSGPQPGLRASLTADGKKIVYSVLRPREEIWILEDVQIREPWYVGLLSRFRR